MTEKPAEEAPKIEFPCPYTIRVMGRTTPDFKEFVIEVMERHGEVLFDEKIQVRESRNSTFVSVAITITATGSDQLTAIHEEFKASGRVQMVL
jgi:putative lipoic acid-binding regulatory protein